MWYDCSTVVESIRVVYPKQDPLLLQCCPQLVGLGHHPGEGLAGALILRLGPLLLNCWI